MMARIQSTLIGGNLRPISFRPISSGPIKEALPKDLKKTGGWSKFNRQKTSTNPPA
jgi:hypothetical protein